MEDEAMMLHGAAGAPPSGPPPAPAGAPPAPADAIVPYVAAGAPPSGPPPSGPPPAAVAGAGPLVPAAGAGAPAIAVESAPALPDYGNIVHQTAAIAKHKESSLVVKQFVQGVQAAANFTLPGVHTGKVYNFLKKHKQHVKTTRTGKYMASMRAIEKAKADKMVYLAAIADMMERASPLAQCLVQTTSPIALATSAAEEPQLLSMAQAACAQLGMEDVDSRVVTAACRTYKEVVALVCKVVNAGGTILTHLVKLNEICNEVRAVVLREQMAQIRDGTISPPSFMRSAPAPALANVSDI